MEFLLEGLFGFIVLILDIIAIIDILSSSKTVSIKILWILLILFLPVIGLILYALFGRESYAPV